MAVGSNIVKLVVQLLADAKDFARELNKGTEVVQEVAKEMSDELSKVSEEVAKETETAVAELETAVTESTTAVTESVKESEEAIKETIRESSDFQVDAAGRVRDAKGRFIKQGAQAHKQADDEVRKYTTTTFKELVTIIATFVRRSIALAKQWAGPWIKAAQEVGRAMRDFASRTVQEMQKLGMTLSKAGGVAFAGMAASIGGATKSAATFEQAMAKATSVLEDMDYNPEFIEKIRRGIDEIAVKFGVDATDAVLAFTDAIQSGVPAGQALEFLGIAAEGAVAANSTLSDSTSYMISMMNAYTLKSDDAAESTDMWRQMMDKTFKAIVLGRVEFKDLSKQIADLAPIAKQAGLKYEDMLAAIATSSLIGRPTAQVMTTLRAALNGLALQEDRTVAVSKSLGIEFNLQAVQTKGLRKFTEELRLAISKNASGLDVYKTKISKTGKVTKELDFHSTGALEILQKLAGSMEAASAWADLLSGEGEILEDVFDGMEESAGAMTKTMNRMVEQDPTFIWRRMWQALAATVRDFGRAVLQFLSPVLPVIFEIIRIAQLWVAENPKLVGAIMAAALAFAAIGAAVLATGLALLTVSGILGALGAVLAPVLALISGLFALISGLAAISLPVLVVALVALVPVIAVLFSALSGIGAILGSVAGGAVVVATNFDKLKQWVSRNWPAIQGAFVAGGVKIVASLKVVGAALWQTLRAYGDALIKWLDANLPAILEFIDKATTWIAEVLIPKIGEFLAYLAKKFGELVTYLKTNGPEIWKSMKEVWENTISILGKVWDIISKVFKAFRELFTYLQDAGWTTAFFNVLKKMIDLLGWVADRVVNIVNAVKELIKRITEFGNNPSLSTLMKLFKFAFSGPSATASSTGGGFSGGTTSRLGLPTTAASRLGSASLASAMSGPATVNNHYELTVHQKTSESADEMLKRMARELQRMRGY